jgi:HPr kinase/phosphorylase
MSGTAALPAVTVEKFYRDNCSTLGLRLVAGANGLKRLIREPTVNRPGLALAGFRRYFAPKRVQVIGNVETAFLRSLPEQQRRQRYEDLFRYPIPCAVMCRGLTPDKALLHAAEVRNIPVFQTDLVTMKFINLATLALDNLFAPRTSVHGSMVDIQGIGVIVQGESGVGKSEAVLGLLERGYSLVTDDVVQLTIVDGRELIGTGKAITRNLMEVRGIGIIDVSMLFGIAAVRAQKSVELVVTLQSWEKVEEIERVGIEQHHIELLGIQVPHMVLPVRPGRDMSRLVEVAALQTKLKASGVNPAEDLQRRVLAQMAPKL